MPIDREGEKWAATGRLPDFSSAGYRRGEEPFCIPDNRVSVTSFGAKGDGRTDDTAAFQQAITSGEGKVIEIPAGRYAATDRNEQKNAKVAKKRNLCDLRGLLSKTIQHRQFLVDVLGRRAYPKTSCRTGISVLR